MGLDTFDAAWEKFNENEIDARVPFKAFHAGVEAALLWASRTGPIGPMKEKPNGRTVSLECGHPIGCARDGVVCDWCIDICAAKRLRDAAQSTLENSENLYEDIRLSLCIEDFDKRFLEKLDALPRHA